MLIRKPFVLVRTELKCIGELVDKFPGGQSEQGRFCRGEIRENLVNVDPENAIFCT